MGGGKREVTINTRGNNCGGGRGGGGGSRTTISDAKMKKCMIAYLLFNLLGFMVWGREVEWVGGRLAEITTSSKLL